MRNKLKTAEDAGMGVHLERLPGAASLARRSRASSSASTRTRTTTAFSSSRLCRKGSAREAEQRVFDAIDPGKDVDGFSPISAGRVVQNREGFAPCTPAGVIELLVRTKTPIEGKHAVVIGRSDIVGKPMAALLLHKNATVTICHSRTRDLPAMARTADILVAAIGRPAFVTRDFVKPGAVVIDVGINSVTSADEAKRIFAAFPERLAGVQQEGLGAGRRRSSRGRGHGGRLDARAGRRRAVDDRNADGQYGPGRGATAALSAPRNAESLSSLVTRPRGFEVEADAPS